MATHHLIKNLQNLNLGSEYSDNQQLHVGNGQGLHISHIGSTWLHTSYNLVLHLKDILYVLHPTKYLISILKLLKENNIIIAFVENMCFAKDKRKEVHLPQGITKGGLYHLLSKNDFVFNSCSLTYVPSSVLSFSLIQLAIFLIYLPIKLVLQSFISTQLSHQNYFIKDLVIHINVC